MLFRLVFYIFFNHFTEDSGRLSRIPPAFVNTFSFVERPTSLPVSPVIHTCNVPAIHAPIFVRNLAIESRVEFPAGLPQEGIILFLRVIITQHTPQQGYTAGQGTTSASTGNDSSGKGCHGFDKGRIIHAKLFLTHGQNRLRSVK